jgi:hypothetical protein
MTILLLHAQSEQQSSTESMNNVLNIFNNIQINVPQQWFHCTIVNNCDKPLPQLGSGRVKIYTQINCFWVKNVLDTSKEEHTQWCHRYSCWRYDAVPKLKSTVTNGIYNVQHNIWILCTDNDSSATIYRLAVIRTYRTQLLWHLWQLINISASYRACTVEG